MMKRKEKLVMQIWNESNIERREILSLAKSVLIAEDLLSIGITDIGGIN